MHPFIKKIFLSSLLSSSLSVFALEIEDLSWEDSGPSAQEFNKELQEAATNKDFWAVIDYANILAYHFPTSPFAQDCQFIIGEAYFNLNQPLLANEYLTHYLNETQSPRRFEDAIAIKFNIAERFREGEKKPLFLSHKAPKILSAKEDAITIYDEVIATLPHSELAPKALLGKAQIQAELEEYKESLDTLDLLIRRFPKHELAAQAYLEKIHVYHMQCLGKSLDPDLLDLAEVTMRKFRLTFPREPKIDHAEEYIHKMEEIFADNLLTTGSFFQKTKKIPAAKIYYSKVISKYPKTTAAVTAEKKLNSLKANEKSPQ